PDPLALKRQALWPGPRVPRLVRRARHGLSPSLLPAQVATASWAGRAAGGFGPGRRDPRRPDRQPLSRRGAPEGLGQAARLWPSHIETPGAAAHARAGPPRAAPGWRG